MLHDSQPIPTDKPYTLVRWKSVVPTPEPSVIQQINTATAVGVVDNKTSARSVLGELGPRTVFRVEDVVLPCIIRPAHHHGGSKFFVCTTPLGVRRAIRRCRSEWYASEIIDKAHEYRVFVLQNRVVAVSERFPSVEYPHIAWNLNHGGRLTNVRYSDWPYVACNAAIAGAHRLGLDWGAMDVVVDQAGRAYVLEGNTAPGLRNPYTMKSIAKCLRWTDAHPNHPLTLRQGDSWKTLRHPGLR